MKKTTKVRVKEPRRFTIAFEKHSHLPPAIVDKKFTAPAESYVWAWRHRAGQKPSWYRCKVVKITDQCVDLWDEAAAQWFSFDPSAEQVPDVRFSS